MSATPNEVLVKIQELKTAKMAYASHQSISKRGLVSKRDQDRLKNNVLRCQSQLVQAAGDDTMVQTLLKYIIEHL